MRPWRRFPPSTPRAGRRLDPGSANAPRDGQTCCGRPAMLSLIPPATRLREAWLEAHAEWGDGEHEDGFGLTGADDVRSPDGFAAWVSRCERDSDCLYRWIVEGDRVLGGIALRHV